MQDRKERHGGARHAKKDKYLCGSLRTLCPDGYRMDRHFVISKRNPAPRVVTANDIVFSKMNPFRFQGVKSFIQLLAFNH
jgi:hypothetical protein